MFIDLNELKGIIVDIDSFPADTDPSWVNVDQHIKLLFFSAQNQKRLEKIKLLSCQFSTCLGTPISIYAKNNVVVEMLEVLGLHSYESAFLSCRYENLVIIQELPISTIQFTSDNKIKYDEVGKLSDFQISSIEDLNAIIKKEVGGYFSEVASVIYNRGATLSYRSANVIVTEKDYLGNKCDVVSGGRYFNTDDVRFHFHQLSLRILRNKRTETQQNSVFLKIYSALTDFVDQEICKVSGITRIPPRPHADDRFQVIVNTICEKKHIENLSSHLSCTKAYASQKGLNAFERESNIRGAFRSTNSVRGKHVVLIDDIISTGATAFEAAKTLYENEASRVTILVLAINQLTNNIRKHKFKPLMCKCGKEFKMNLNRNNNAAFFGCSGFVGGTCSATLNYFEAVRIHNVNNAIMNVEEEIDTDNWLF